jgi:hypothetical protein
MCFLHTPAAIEAAALLQPDPYDQLFWLIAVICPAFHYYNDVLFLLVT